jgi:murein DD-endopeptidase MepM/ murein hydrolase activator NlpD
MSYEGAVARVASIEAQLAALTGPRPAPPAASAPVATTTPAASAFPPGAPAVTAAPTDFQSVLASAQAGAQGPAAAGYPLATRGKLIGFPYQGSHTLYGNWESDNAVDIATPTGTPVYAVEDGTIGSQIGAINSSDPHLMGLRVHLDSADNEYYYAHLSKLVVTAGQQVHKGDLIGYSGSANGVEHLHFAVRDGSPLSVVS